MEKFHLLFQVIISVAEGPISSNHRKDPPSLNYSLSETIQDANSIGEGNLNGRNKKV